MAMGLQVEIKSMLTQKVLSFSTGLWEAPLVSFVNAQHPGFNQLKLSVNPKHFLPQDLLKSAQGVIVYFIPFSEEVVSSNQTMGLASELWAYSYVQTNLLIQKINVWMQELLRQKGYDAATIPATNNFDPIALLSRWSHRHVAEIAGLGKIGLNNMLITQEGCCGRLGSLVTDWQIESIALESKERCLFRLNGSCGICAAQCLTGALTVTGFKREQCYAQCLKNADLYKSMGDASVCGKCLTGLPCSLKSPEYQP